MNELDASDKVLLRRAMMRLDSANEIMRFLSEHFRDKYGLTPDNQITPDGQIVSMSTEKMGNWKTNGADETSGALQGLSGVPTER